MGFLIDMVAHAAADTPNEACGLVVARGDRVRLVRGANIASNPRTTFDLDPEAWLEVTDDEEVIGTYHSHPFGTAAPSVADLTACELSGVPMHIVTPAGDYRRIEPHGYRAPYLNRPYVHGVHDCYALPKDWYEWEWGIVLPDVERSDHWWEKGQNLYLDHLEQAGFVRVDDEPQIGDGFLAQVMSPVPNHAMVYVGDGAILHHAMGRLSSRDVYGGMWQRFTTHHLRHISRIKHG